MRSIEAVTRTDPWLLLPKLWNHLYLSQIFLIKDGLSFRNSSYCWLVCLQQRLKFILLIIIWAKTGENWTQRAIKISL